MYQMLSRCIAALLLAALGHGASAQMAPELAAGYKAYTYCNGLFLAGRTIQQLESEELDGFTPSDKLPDPVVNYTDKYVTVAYDGRHAPRVAVFHENYGTIVLPPGAAPGDRPKLPEVRLIPEVGQSATLPWPTGEQLQETPLPEGMHRAAIDAVVNSAFDCTRHPRTRTTGVLVLHQGKIIAERYAPGWTKDTPMRAWAAGIGIANALTGILVKQGKLQVQQQVIAPAWPQDDPRRQIRIEHLLEMNSGLNAPGGTFTPYWSGINATDFAATHDTVAAPGGDWNFSPCDTQLLVAAIQQAIGNDDDYLTFPRRELLEKIGMRRTVLEIDPYGNFLISGNVQTTARDLARLCLLFKRDGVWEGERILPEGWLDYSLQPAAGFKPLRAEDTRVFAKHWWLQKDARLPEGCFGLTGARGQYATVVPSHKLVVVRMSLDGIWDRQWDQAAFVREIIDAMAAQPVEG